MNLDFDDDDKTSDNLMDVIGYLDELDVSDDIKCKLYKALLNTKKDLFCAYVDMLRTIRVELCKQTTRECTMTKIRCKKCGDVIQSKHRHDMVWCKCGAIAIDGGDDYCKITGKLDDFDFVSPETLSTVKIKEMVDGHK
jgi:hypothetical protein